MITFYAPNCFLQQKFATCNWLSVERINWALFARHIVGNKNHQTVYDKWAFAAGPAGKLGPEAGCILWEIVYVVLDSSFLTVINWPRHVDGRKKNYQQIAIFSLLLRLLVPPWSIDFLFQLHHTMQPVQFSCEIFALYTTTLLMLMYIICVCRYDSEWYENSN
jgi:hypothetical protein